MRTVICAVVCTDEDEKTVAEFESTVTTAFDDCYPLTRSTILVRAPMLTSEIAEKVDLKGDGRRFTGAVLRVDDHYYSGYALKELWDWLARSEQETGTPAWSRAAETDPRGRMPRKPDAHR